MRKNEQDEMWVIYQAISGGVVTGPLAVCSQNEWEKFERDHPGQRSLVQGGIANEGVAERLARGTSGDAKPRGIPRTSGFADPNRDANRKVLPLP